MIRDFDGDTLPDLMARAAALRDAGHGNTISYSRKVFIPLTHLCRDTCRYCTFAQSPKPDAQAYLSPDRVVEIARQGQAMGCREALFTLGDRPEARWPQARKMLAAMGFASTLDYLGHVAARVRDETTLFPHLNPGLMDAADLATLRAVAPSMGIMLEGVSSRLTARGGPHFGCPDKEPARRLKTIALAGEARIPFTSGLLIGIGETRHERIEALLALKALDDRYGHVQEVIVQPFRPKPGTPMARVPAAPLEELLWTIAVARILFGAQANIQAPPNLTPGDVSALLAAGINDLGGISPLTPDFVNPEAPWPHLDRLADEVAACGHRLAERLTIYPRYAVDAERWVDRRLLRPVLAAVDGAGWPREDDWTAGTSPAIPAVASTPWISRASPAGRVLTRAEAGASLDERDLVTLFDARGDDFQAVRAQADALRETLVGPAVSYVITRNINYTNICTYRCSFCAFSKGKVAAGLRSAPYTVDLGEIARRTMEASARGATEICMQGGIHPDYTGDTYREILAAAKQAAPGIHVHAFSPLEIASGASSLGISVAEFLIDLRNAGLGSLPGTAAEILDDEVRARICPDKLDTEAWLDVIRTAHRVGLRTTSTIMFGHVDHYSHWARHLLRLRDLQGDTGGITEFVPLPFVASEAPIYRRGRSRRGPTYREAVLMHAVARICFGALLPNIQTSWVKMGEDGALDCLKAGANDFGGTLMNETITRSAGAIHGQEMSPARFETLIGSIGRIPRQRSTLYDAVRPSRAMPARAAPLLPVIERRVGC